MDMQGRIRVGVGGWTFEPWRKGVFYPEGLAHARELAYASRALTSIEINGTFYSTFKPDSWRKWARETPDDFVFAVKGSRYVTNRKQLAGAGPSLERFVGQGLTELGPKLGPINWQLAPTKRFDPADIAAFFALLPRRAGGIALQHAIEVRHPSFNCEGFVELARANDVAIVQARSSEFPEIDARTAAFTYARVMITNEQRAQGVTRKELAWIAERARTAAQRGDVYVYFISGAKQRNPSAALALIKVLGTPTSAKPVRAGSRTSSSQGRLKTA